MSRVFEIFILFILMAPSVSWPKDKAKCERRLSPVTVAFKKAYLNPNIYREGGQCGINVKNLLLFFKDEGVPLRNPQVIYILHEYQNHVNIPNPYGHLTPIKSRGWNEYWRYHAILQYDDPATGMVFILDLDAPGAKPYLVDEYFKLVFPEREDRDRYAQMVMRIIDPVAYVKAFETIPEIRRGGRIFRDEILVTAQFLEREIPEYPTMTVREYMNAH